MFLRTEPFAVDVKVVTLFVMGNLFIGSGIVDFDSAIDITDEVVRRYDASKASAAPVKK